MNNRTASALTVVLLLGLAQSPSVFAQRQAPSEATAAPRPLSAEAKHGKYLVQIGGCNDCHTTGYGPSGGKVREQDWLT